MQSDTTLKELANKLEDNKTKDLQSYITGVHDELVGSKVNNIVPEIVFKEYFLDFFFNISKHPESSTLSLKWTELAGGPYSEVDVVDSFGNKIFTVPSLFSRPKVNDEHLKHMSFSNIAGKFEAKANRIYADGINYLNMELSSLPKEISSSSDEEVIRWISIFKRYAINAPKVSNISKQVKEDLGLDYD